MGIDITRCNEPDGGRYRLLVDGTEAGELDFYLFEGARVFTHTGVRDAFEGRGLAAKLAERALADARADGVHILPRCPYIRGYLEHHPEHADLVDHALWDQLRGR